MNNITSLPTPVNYPDLDICTYIEAARSASEAATHVKSLSDKTDYLPSLRSQVSNLDNAIRNAIAKQREVATTLDVKMGLEVRTLRQHQTDLKHDDGTEEQEILEDIDKEILDILKLVETCQSQLGAAQVPLTKTVDRAVTGSYVSGLNAEKQRIPDEIQQIETRKTELENKRKALTDAMNAIEAKGFNEVGKESLLGPNELAKLATTPPEMVAIEKGIELARDILKQLESFMRYVDLIDARDAVRTQLESATAKSQALASELNAIDSKIRVIEESYTFDDQRERFVGEYAKLTQATRSFLNAYRATRSNDEAAVSRITVDALALAAYIKSIA